MSNMNTLQRNHFQMNLRAAQARYKSVTRAIKRGHLDPVTLEPIRKNERVYSNNRKMTKGRKREIQRFFTKHF